MRPGRIGKRATLWSPPPAPRRSNAPSRGGRDRGQEGRVAGGREGCQRKWSLTGPSGTNPSQTLRLSLSSVGVLSDSLDAHTEEVSLIEVTSDSTGWKDRSCGLGQILSISDLDLDLQSI